MDLIGRARELGLLRKRLDRVTTAAAADHRGADHCG